MQRVWGRGEACTGFQWGTSAKESTWKTKVQMEGNMLYLLKRDVGDMDWIELAQDREGWRAIVNAVMNLRVP